MWHAPARELIGAAGQWQKWALYDCRPLKRWGKGPVTLLGDAAHPMLPYLAQGAAMAIEDAAVLAACLAQAPDDTPAALRNYEAKRQKRTARAQIAARRNGTVYHMGGATSCGRSRSWRRADAACCGATTGSIAGSRTELPPYIGCEATRISPWITTCTAMAIGRRRPA